MFTYFKMKRKQWKIRNAVYNNIIGFTENKNDIINIVKKLFDSVKDMSAEEIKDEFIGKLADIVHEASKKTEDG